MEHNYNLFKEPFLKIENGTKTIELRLNDSKRKLLKVGDIIIFTCKEIGKSIKVRVTNLSCFSSFEELYKSVPLLECGYDKDSINSANSRDMEQYYPKEMIEKFGALAIKIQLI